MKPFLIVRNKQMIIREMECKADTQKQYANKLLDDSIRELVR